MKSSPGLTQQAIGISGCQRLWICSFSVAGWLRSTLISVSVMTKLLGPLRGLGATGRGYGASLERRRKTANTSDDVCPAPALTSRFPDMKKRPAHGEHASRKALNLNYCG